MLTIFTPRIMMKPSIPDSTEHSPQVLTLQSGSGCYTSKRYSHDDPPMLTFDEYVTDVLLRDLVGHDRRPVAFLVYLWIAAEQQRRSHAVKISYQDLAESVGISKSSAQASVGWLVQRKLLAVARASVTATPTYNALTPWNRERKSGQNERLL